MILFVVFFSFSQLENIKKNSLKQEEEIENLRSRVLLHSYYSGNYYLSEEFNLADTNGGLKIASEVFKKKSVILYLNSNYCHTCVDDAIAKMRNSKKKYSNIEFVVITRGYSLRELKLMQTNKNIQFPVYSVDNSKSSFLEKMKETPYPFYFVINDDLQVSNIFFPMKSSSILENRYFSQFNSK